MSTPMPSKTWLMQHNFPEIKTTGEKSSTSGPTTSNCLLKVQSFAPDKHCIVNCGPHTLRPSESISVKFEMVPSPIGSHFIIELGLCPLSSTGTFSATDHARHKAERMYALFATYDEQGPRYGDREPYPYTSNMGNTPPAGPLNFSQQLYDVRFTHGDKRPAEVPAFLEDDLTKQLCFSWKSVRCVRFAFSRPTAHLSTAAQQAAVTFVGLIDHLTSKAQPTVHVVTKNMPLLASVYWPWFASVPSPVPESYWPWVYPLNVEKPLEVMIFPPNKTFERFPQYIDRALAVREKGWLKKDLDLNKLPTPLELAELPTTTRFIDYRQYIAVILGAHGYEEMYSNQNLERWFNGRHSCDVHVESGSLKYLILLNIRPPVNDNEPDSSKSLPAVDERVDIRLTSNQREQMLTGRVVRIPSKYAKYARNVAILAESPPTDSGRITSSVYSINGDFYFGHYGSPSSPIRERILELMTGTNSWNGGAWLKGILLAHDNYNVPNNSTNFASSMPKNFKDVVDEVCKDYNLNQGQIAVVRHYFTNKITLCNGPPGTGKSTLIDAILTIEERLNQKFWVCTESNAAVNVLAEKMCRRKGTLQPEGFLRLKPAFEETLSVDSRGSDGPQIVALPERPDTKGEESAEQAIFRFLRLNVENVERCMSLEAMIKRRVAAQLGKGAKQIYPKEHDDLMDLRAKYTARYRLKLDVEGKTTEEYVREEQGSEKKLLNVLRKIQSEYTAHAKGVFSTTAAACGPFLRRNFKPAAMIMDEASQFMEARAVHPIIHAMAGGALQRVLLIGDELQLPPTIVAPRNPFRQTAQLSLFERLIKSGFPALRLTEQFRMHPSISKICNDCFYHNLTDGANTLTRNGVSKFQAFIKGFAERSKTSISVDKANAVVVSPIQHPNLPWGSSKARGSTSRFNLLSARMVYMMAYELIAKGNFAARDIMVISFYTDQQTLLQALFADVPNFNGIQFDTIDGSQGHEAPVVIIDCVVLGAAAQDGMGFLGVEQRRFNVAMSRAQVGRITIAHRDMIKKTKDKSGHEKESNAGPWNKFFEQARSDKAIINGHLLNGDWPVAQLKTRFDDVKETWMKATQEKQVAHSNIREQKNPEKAKVLQTSGKVDYELLAFMDATGADEKIAKEYIEKAKGLVAIAVNAYFSKYGSDLVVEEI